MNEPMPKRDKWLSLPDQQTTVLDVMTNGRMAAKGYVREQNVEVGWVRFEHGDHVVEMPISLHWVELDGRVTPPTAEMGELLHRRLNGKGALTDGR